MDVDVAVSEAVSPLFEERYRLLVSDDKSANLKPHSS